MVDIGAFGLILGQVVGRVGCILNGCCHGTCTTAAWGVSFPSESPAGYFQHMMNCQNLHPSQLYESAGGLAIFGIILLSERWKRFDGHSFFLFLILYSILRFGDDFTRYYTKDEMWAGLSHNQIFCILLFLVASVSWAVLFRRAQTAEAASQPVRPNAEGAQV